MLIFIDFSITVLLDAEFTLAKPFCVQSGLSKKKNVFPLGKTRESKPVLEVKHVLEPYSFHSGDSLLKLICFDIFFLTCGPQCLIL